MDPPDGGDVLVSEQLRRIAKDAVDEIERMRSALDWYAECLNGCSNAGPAYDHMMQHPEGTSSPVECTECTVGLINAIEMHANQSKYTVNINPELISCILNLIEASKPGADRTKSTEITVKLGDLDTLCGIFSGRIASCVV